MPDPALASSWSDRLHNYLANLVTAVVLGIIGSIGLYMQQHPVPTPVVQTAPVPVVNVQPAPADKLTLEQVVQRLQELTAESKGKP